MIPNYNMTIKHMIQMHMLDFISNARLIIPDGVNMDSYERGWEEALDLLELQVLVMEDNRNEQANN